jgi:nicotinamide riboside kinase
VHDVVVCDTTGLMTAVYSRHVFGDRSLEERAAALHGRMALTLLTALDLPWVADGHQRDGPQVREPVDAMLRELMDAHGLGYAVVSGVNEQRLEAAAAACGPLLRARAPVGSGLFTGMGRAPDRRRTAGWACDCCVPAAERALRRGASDPV